jgi:DNA-binding response OmpR family regulator
LEVYGVTDKARIIVVEDDARMANVIERHLKGHGFDVTTVSSGTELRRAYRSDGADLVLLDLNLGSEDGIDLARELVRTTSAGLIIVTGRDALQDRIAGLDSGADDYVVKPFDPDELVARVRAVLRRHLPTLPRDEKIRVGPYVLDAGRLTLMRDDLDSDARMTETETRILLSLLQHFNRAVSRSQLLGREVQGTDDRIVAVHIANIRRKLKDAGMDDLVIWPVRGCGYRMRVEPGLDVRQDPVR